MRLDRQKKYNAKLRREIYQALALMIGFIVAAVLAFIFINLDPFGTVKQTVVGLSLAGAIYMGITIHVNYQYLKEHKISDKDWETFLWNQHRYRTLIVIRSINFNTMTVTAVVPVVFGEEEVQFELQMTDPLYKALREHFGYHGDGNKNEFYFHARVRMNAEKPEELEPRNYDLDNRRDS